MDGLTEVLAGNGDTLGAKCGTIVKARDRYLKMINWTA